MPAPILNLDDVNLEPWAPGAILPEEISERYGARMGQIGTRIGARKLGYNLTAVAPGKSAFPRHNHHANEEMFFIVQGSGELQVGAARYPIRSGDVIACPPGGPDTAHKIFNTGSEELRYLAVSTKQVPEVVDYPDSGKFGVLSEVPGAEGAPPQRFMFAGRANNGVSYWDGE
jgi:uncharacterized cupin superfamily protein